MGILLMTDGDMSPGMDSRGNVDLSANSEIAIKIIVSFGLENITSWADRIS
jgi:hypothetical protein